MRLDQKINAIISPRVIISRTRDDEAELMPTDIEGLFAKDEFRVNGRVVQEPADLLAKCTAALDRAGPVLIDVNFEGGNFSHLNHPGLTQIISAAALGTADNVDTTQDIAHIAGQELHAMGLSWNFAPVAELNKNPHFLGLGIRTFGDDPERVARQVAAYVRGMQSACVAATAKHFPGIGNTSCFLEDSYPLITSDINEGELLPFRAAVDAGVSFIMPRHGIYTSIDGTSISTFSRKFMDFLREKLHYPGIITTDSLSMGQLAKLTKERGIGQLAVDALNAGADHLLVESTISYGSTDTAVMTRIQENFATAYLTVHNAVKHAVLAGDIDLDARVEKHERVREAFAPMSAPLPDNLQTILGNNMSSRTVAMAARHAVTLVKNNGLLPLKPNARLLLVRCESKKSHRADCITDIPASLEQSLARKTSTFDAIVLSNEEDLAAINEARENYDCIVVASYCGYARTNGLDIQAAAVRKASLLWPDKTVIVLQGVPLEATPDIDPGAIVVANDIRKPTLDAIADVLFERAPIAPYTTTCLQKSDVHPALKRPSKKRVSVIIPTTGGDISPVLECLCDDVSSLEDYAGRIIVALNNWTPETEAATETLQKKYGFVLERAPRGKYNAVAHTVRTHGKDAKFIILADDDIIPVIGSMQNMLRDVERSPNQSLLAGAVPMPMIDIKDQTEVQRFWREVFASNRSEKGYFRVPRLPWGQFLCMHVDRFPFMPGTMPFTTNDSFLYLAAFFPDVSITKGAHYHYVPSDNLPEYALRKARIKTGIDDVLEHAQFPYLGQLMQVIAQERQIMPGVDLNKTIHLAVYQLVNELVQAGKTTEWPRPISTKDASFDYRALRKVGPGVCTENEDFSKLITQEVAIPANDAIYLME